MGWTTDDLVSRARIYAGEPSESESGISASDALQLADDDLHSYVFPRLLMANEEYAVTYADQSIVAGTASYAIPTRAYASGLRDVLYLPTSAEQVSVPLVDPEAIGTTYRSTESGSEVRVCYLQGSNLVLWPTPSASSGTLRLKFTRKPSTLVAASACALVSGIGAPGATKTITCSTGVPATWASSEYTDIVDVDRPDDPTYTDEQATSINSTTDTMVYLATQATGMAVGNYICLDGQTCVPPLPTAMHPWLARRLAALMLEARGDHEAMRVAQSKCDEMEERLVQVLQPRVVGEPHVIVPRFSPFRCA